MSETKHTPGPWKFCPSIENDFLGVYPDTGKPEFPIAKMPEIIRPEINEANGRLIAAAPRLLYAMEALEPYLDAIVCYASTMDEHEPNRLAFNARAAISEAVAGFVGPPTRSGALSRRLSMSRQGNAVHIEFDSEADATAAFDAICSPPAS